MINDLWRELPFSAGPIDEELAGPVGILAGLRAAGPPTLRWYGASGLGLVLGAGQRLSDADLAACQVLGASLHKRASGGTAVLFEPGLLMQDIALPAEHPLHSGDVTESYRWLGEVWVGALARLGIAATLIGVAEARADTQALGALERRACFGGRSPYELLAAGRKLVGLSQIRRREGAILQVGLYTRWSPAQLAQLLALGPAERAALSARLGQRVVGLADLLPVPPTPEAIGAAFAEALAARGIGLAPATWGADELAARAAARERYGDLR
jgi:lipoate-protein ligase A